MKSEQDETSGDESAESDSTEKQEQDTGTEGVKLPEDFQKQVHATIEGMCDTQAKCDYVSQCVSDKRMALMKEDDSKSKKPAKFTAEDEPAY